MVSNVCCSVALRFVLDDLTVLALRTKRTEVIFVVIIVIVVLAHIFTAEVLFLLVVALLDGDDAPLLA